jgi:GNAT superfamily N-acetyltransferase
MQENLKILRLKGPDIIPFIPELARLRINIFKEYPYLYDGNLDYEYKYLDTYIKCPESVIVFALDHNKVVGASSGIPLEFETIELQKPFLDNQINIQDVFYFGESVLEPEYRGRNIYRQFFAQREAAAREYGCKIAAFAAVERDPDDPRKPKDYVPLDDVWKYFGYEKHPELYAYFEWKEVGEKIQTPKPMIFWLKKL